MDTSNAENYRAVSKLAFMSKVVVRLVSVVIVRPLIKKADLDTSKAQDYRLISKLAFVSKVVERLVCGQLVDFLEHSSLLSSYRRMHSTEPAVLKVITDLLLANARHEVILLCS